MPRGIGRAEYGLASSTYRCQ